jgi:hypothetical protein
MAGKYCAREYFGVTENVRTATGEIVIGVCVYKGNQSRDGLKRENIIAIFYDEDAAREFIFGITEVQELCRELVEHTEEIWLKCGDIERRYLKDKGSYISEISSIWMMCDRMLTKAREKITQWKK